MLYLHNVLAKLGKFRQLRETSETALSLWARSASPAFPLLSQYTQNGYAKTLTSLWVGDYLIGGNSRSARNHAYYNLRSRFLPLFICIVSSDSRKWCIAVTGITT